MNEAAEPIIPDQQQEEEGAEESSSSSSEDQEESDYDDDSSLFDSEEEEVDDEDMQALEEMYAQAERAKARLREAAQKEWNGVLEGLATRKTTMLKITEPNVIGIFASNVDAHLDALLNATDRRIHGGRAILTHVNFSKVFLQSLDFTRQERLFLALFTQHASTLAYIRLVADNAAMNNATNKVQEYTPNVILHTSAWLTPLTAVCQSSNNTILTQMEIRTLDIESPATVQQLVYILQHNRESLKQVNWLGIHLVDSKLNAQKGLLDPVVDFVATSMPQLDELRLQVLLESDNKDGAADRTNLVTHGALKRLLTARPKWWRLSLDGVGLDDGHATILGKAFASSDNCRTGDLLSLTDNPRLTKKAVRELFVDTFYQKARMGLIQVDAQHAYYEAQFDLVRPLNNLHGRLDALKQGALVKPTKWIDWLHKLSNLKWLDDAHKINYIWFTLLEKPEMVKLHSNNNTGSSGE